MSDALRAQYAASRYPTMMHPWTHPGRLAAIARLFDLETPNPKRARILDIGTGQGTNIIQIARSLPGATCIGIDLVPEAIAAARKTAKQLNVFNVEFHAVDLMEREFGGQQFDYIIAHGFFSWVPEPVQDRLFEVCRDTLANRGVAMISYNAMPGAMWRDALRRLMLLEWSESSNPESHAEGLAAAERVIAFFRTAGPALDNLPHGEGLKQVINAMRNLDKGVFVHDELGEIWEPYYLLQFTQWAAESRLAYVADADLKLDWMDIYPKPLRKAIVDGRMPRLKALQFADYVINTGFRRSIVCKATDAAKIKDQPDLIVMRDLWIRGRDASREPMTGAPRLKPLAEPSDPVIYALLAVIQGHRAEPTQFSALVPRIHQHLADQGQHATDDQALAKAALFAASEGRLDISVGPECMPVG